MSGVSAYQIMCNKIYGKGTNGSIGQVLGLKLLEKRMILLVSIVQIASKEMSALMISGLLHFQ